MTRNFKFLVLVTCLLSSIALACRAEPSRFELRAVADAPSPGTQEFVLPARNDDPSKKLVLEPTVLLDSTALRSASVVAGYGTKAGVTITLTDAAAKRFVEITASHLGKRLAIILDGSILLVPVINEMIYAGATTLSGFRQEEAEDIVSRLHGIILKPAT